MRTVTVVQLPPPATIHYLKIRFTTLSLLLLALVPGCGGSPGAGHTLQADRDDSHPGETMHHDPDHSDEHSHGHGGGAMHHDFDDAEQWAKRFDAKDRDQWQKPKQVIDLMDLTPGMTAVDLGAGTGYFLPHLATAVGPQGRVVGLDISPDMVRYLNERIAREGLANTTARRVDAGDPMLEDGCCDRILIVNTWHHIAERKRYAAMLARALRPGGAVVIVDFTPDSERGPPRDHRLDPATVTAELASAGLATDIATEDLPDQYIVIGRSAN